MRLLIYNTGAEMDNLTGVAEAADVETVFPTDSGELMEAGPVEIAVIPDNGENWVQLVKHLSEQGTAVYVVAEKPDLDTWETAANAGAKSVWKQEKAAQEMAGVLKRWNNDGQKNSQVGSGLKKQAVRPVRKRSQTKGEPNGSKVTQPVQGGVNQVVPRYHERSGGHVNQQEKKGSKELIVIYSSDGGVGKTTLSINLATALAASKAAGNSVCLVELDPYHCHICSRLGIMPTTTILDWVVGHQDDLKNYLVDFKVARLGKENKYMKVLPAPYNPADEVVVTAEITEKLLNILYRRFDKVIVDTCPTLTRDSTLAALDMASKIYMVITPDKSQIANIYADYEILSKMDTGVISKAGLVVNRASKRSPVRMADIKDNIPLPLTAVIPEDVGVQVECNREQVPVMGRRAKQFNEQLLKLANTIEPVFEAEQKTKIKLPRIFSRKKEVYVQ